MSAPSISLIASAGSRSSLANFIVLYSLLYGAFGAASSAGIRQDARFYRAWAPTGGALGAAWMTGMPLLDASGIKDPWYALIMIATALVVFIPMMIFLKRLRREGG